jgi:hypothetical protein
MVSLVNDLIDENRKNLRIEFSKPIMFPGSMRSGINEN